MILWSRVIRLIRLSIKMELDGWRSLYLLAIKRTVAPASAKAFSYYRETRTILFVFIGLSAIEIPIFDLVLSRWPAIRWPFLVLGIWGFMFMLGIYAGLRVHPHFVTNKELVIYAGPNFRLAIPKEQIYSAFFDERNFETSKGFQIDETEGDLRINLVTMNQTNVSLEFKRPLLVTKGPKSYEVRQLAFFADDARSLIEAL